jgi:hypothetical protein
MRQPLISAISVIVLCLLLTSARSGEVVEATVCDIEKYGQCGSVYLKAGCHVSRDARVAYMHMARGVYHAAGVRRLVGSRCTKIASSNRVVATIRITVLR